MAIKFGQKIKTEGSAKNYWVTSDLHFYHKGVLNFCPATRPWISVEDMNEGLVSHWNETVSVVDEVLFLGDFSFRGREATEAILTRLHGNITFVLGNHDRTLREQIDGLTTYDYLEFKFNDTKVCALHFPIAAWNQQGRGSIQLYGHCHGNYQGEGRQIDCGWDAHGRLISLQEAVDTCLGRDIYCPDHHKIVEK